MNGFERASSVEMRGMEILQPFIEEKSGGRYVLTNKGELARYLQLIAGDLLYNDPETGRMYAVEVKIEQKHTGNLFLETWSNRNLDCRRDFSSHGSNPGWLVHLRADLLLYYFLDSDFLYVVDLFQLKRWCFGYQDAQVTYGGNIYLYPERRQRKYEQKNDTYGRLVPVDDLMRPWPVGLGGKIKRLRLLDGVREDRLELKGQLELHEVNHGRS